MSEQDTEKVDVVEILEPSAQIFTIVLAAGTDRETVLYQKPLSFFRKIEFFSVLGEAIEKALAEGTTISEILDVPESAPGTLTTGDLKEADMFVKAIARVVRFVPDLLEDVYCISLNVRRGEREEVKELLREMDDEQGMEILNNFVDQNWDAMMDFFSKQMSQLLEKVSQKVQSRSMSLKP